MERSLCVPGHRAAERHTPEELLGRNATMLVQADDLDEVAMSSACAGRSRVDAPGRVSRLTASGAVTWAEADPGRSG
jgi:hypothetical protein